MSSVASANARIKERDVRLSRRDWERTAKQTIRLRCAAYGLSSTGKKSTLVARLYAYLHQGDIPAHGAQNVDLDTHPATPEPQEEGEPVPGPSGINNSGLQQNRVPLDELRAIIRDEIQQHTPVRGNQQLSPASSIARPIHQGDVHLPSQGQMLNNVQTQGAVLPVSASNQGNDSLIFASRSVSISSLPPLSSKLLKAIQSKDYVDFNLLLPNSLYDSASHVSFGQISLQVKLAESGEATSVTSDPNPLAKKPKINSSATWLEAWNIFIRCMVNFHPELAHELLAYQELICSFHRQYPVTAWLRYDTAFRMNIGLNKTLSWARLDDYAFNKFMRCSTSQPSVAPICFQCNMSGHYANNCPNWSFRPYQQNPHAFNANQRNSNATRFSSPKGNACRHYNSSNRCYNPNCKFQHKCVKCGGPHPGAFCSQPF